MERFREIIEHRHEYAQAWKQRTGGKILGYFCSYVPEEIIYAAGILPVRIIGSHEPKTRTERHITEMYCPYCRDCLAQGLRGSYSYLDGIVMAPGCQHIRQAFASWELHIPVDYTFLISMPNLVQSPSAIPFLIRELSRFKRSLEEWTGMPISDEALSEAIITYNLNRRLLMRIYNLRKNNEPPLSGAEALEITLSGHLTDKREHTRLLSEAIKEIQRRTKCPKPGVRLMFIGSEIDDINYLNLIESLGCIIVTDETCTGSRYFWNECLPSSNLLDAIARRYIDRPPCPVKDLPLHRRLNHMLEMIKEYRVEGVIITTQKFCHNHETDLPAIQSLLQKEGIPVLTLEYSFNTPVEWIQVRIEAFLEIFQSDLMWG